MAIWFTSDLHFGHRAVVARRGFGGAVEAHDNAILNVLHAFVLPTDKLYILGDVSFHKHVETMRLLRQLPVRPILIYGNHDKPLQSSRYEDLFIRRAHYEILSNGALPVVMSHYAMRTWERSHYGAIQVHGHSHGALPPLGRSVDIGWDARWVADTSRPIHLDELVAWAQARPLHNAEDL